LLKLNRAAEAEALLNGKGKGRDGGGSDYYLGVALAHQGKIGEAIRCLQQACQQPMNGEAAQQALLALLKRQVQQKLARRDWDGASAVLSQALDLDPDNPELQQMLSVLGNHLPITYLKANQRAAAAAAWEKAQQQNPGDLRIAHSLGLLYFWWAQELEEQQQGQQAVKAWEGAIRNWVALSYGNGFWTRWKEERGQVYGPIPETAVKDLRRRLTEQLGRKIADYQNAYLTRQCNADARRMGDLSLKLAAELKTAEALQQVSESLQRQKRQAPLPPLCGVLMLNHLGQLETAQKVLALVEATQAHEASTEQLHWCLSPWVFPWIMVQERRYEEAIEHLEKKLKQNVSSQDGHDLLAMAYLGRGKLQAASGEIEGALGSWQAGLGHVRVREKVADEIRKEAENAAIREATRLQSEDGREGLKRAVQLLEKVRPIIETQRIKENLSELYTTLGVIAGNDGNMDQAKKHLEQALKLNPDNGRAKENLALVLLDEGIGSYNRGQYTAALRLLRRAYELAPGNGHVRQQVSLGLSNYGVHRWNQGYHAEGDRLLREALEIDPTNEHALKNLLAAGSAGLSVNDLEVLMRILRNQ